MSMISQYETSLRMADADNAELRRENALLRELVTALGLPRVYNRREAHGHRIVQCAYCGKYLKQWHVTQHLDGHSKRGN